MSRRTELQPLVNQFQHDSHRKRAPEALIILQKIASAVKPVMRQRNWIVGTLCEFYPPETNLLGLNINRGQKICIRLRYPGDENQFLPMEEMVDTMLHELCHIVHGPHDQHFHALWNQLRDEHEALLRKGYTGEGFLGRGERLGGGRIPMHEAKRKARAAAEKRKALTAGSGQKLGGAPVMRGQDIRKTIVDAIERRRKIEQGCASGTDKGRQIAHDVETKKDGITMTQALDEDANEAVIMQAYIDLIQEEEREKYGDNYKPPSQQNPAGMRSTSMSPGLPHAAVEPQSMQSLIQKQASIERTLQRKEVPPAIPTDTKPPAIRRPSQPSKTPLIDLSSDSSSSDSEMVVDQPPETWTCDICTLVNPLNYLICDACETERPSHFLPPPSSHSSTKNPRSSTSTSTCVLDPGGKHNSLKPRLKASDSLAKISAQEAERLAAKPMGWVCGRCGNWMEQQWWTCNLCGVMKGSS